MAIEVARRGFGIPMGGLSVHVGKAPAGAGYLGVVMKKNMGRADRLVRSFVVAPVAVVVGLLVGPAAVVSWVLYAVAAVMLGTSGVGFCPLYAAVGISTCPRRDVPVADRVLAVT